MEPSRELTYPPISMAFWVDDFPNFPVWWDMLIFPEGILYIPKGSILMKIQGTKVTYDLATLKTLKQHHTALQA